MNCALSPYWVKGLSPLARGNQRLTGDPSSRPGPIPARAGEPAAAAAFGFAIRAYPRSRGGTTVTQPDLSGFMGLSPLARGNLQDSHNLSSCEGPIPARAGEPPVESALLMRYWAYPRSRGGTERILAIPILQLGLSPLARGNLRGQPAVAA